MADRTRNSHASPPPAGGLEDFPLRRGHLLLAAGCVAVVYLIGVTGKWWPSPDSAMYLTLGRSLARGQGYQFNGETCNVVTPGLPAMLAALRLMFGGGYWAPNLFMAVCGMAAVALAYRAMSRLTSPRMALAATLCCAFSYTFYFACHRILTDAPFALLFWASVCASLRARRGSLWWLLAGAALAVAALTVRIPGVMTVGPMAVGLLLDRTEIMSRKRLIALGCGLLAVAAGSLGLFYLLGKHVSEAEPLYTSSLQGLLGMLSYLGQGLVAYPRAVAEMLTGQKGFVVFGLLATACLVIGGTLSWMRGLRLPITCVVLNVAGVALVGGANAVRSRYLLPVLPFIAYLTMEGLMAVTWVIVWRVKRRRYRLAPLIAATAFVVFAVGFNAPRLLRNATYYSYLSHTPRYYDVIRHGRHAELLPVADLLRELCPPEMRIAVLGDDVSVIHYLTERRIIHPRFRRYDDKEISQAMKDLHAKDDASAAVMDMSEGPEEFRWALRWALEQSGRFERVFEGRRWHVYRYTGPPPAPDTRQAGRPVGGFEEDDCVERELLDPRT